MDILNLILILKNWQKKRKFNRVLQYKNQNGEI